MDRFLEIVNTAASVAFTIVILLLLAGGVAWAFYERRD